MDISRLKDLYARDDCAKWVLDSLAERKRNTSETSLDVLEENASREKQPWDRKRLLDLLTELAEIGGGDVYLGRKTRPTRIEWKFRPISLAKAARGESEQIEPYEAADALAAVDLTDLDEVPTNSVEDSNGIASDYIRHRYHLRDGHEIHIDLPRDLSSREAVRLADFIKTLPID